MQTCGRLSEGSKRATNFYELEAQVKSASSLEESLVRLRHNLFHGAPCAHQCRKGCSIGWTMQIQPPSLLKQLQLHSVIAGQLWCSLYTTSSVPDYRLPVFCMLGRECGARI